MTNADRCPGCNGLFALIGRVHRCRPAVAEPPDVSIKAGPAGEVVQGAGITKTLDASFVPGSTTYKHRDPDKWRAYMRGYMQRYRAKKNSSGAAAK